MPNAPAVACHCGKLDCTRHTRTANRKQADQQRRNDPLRAIYNTARWQRTRAAVLARDPLCRMAELCRQQYGVAMPSTEADHIIPIRAGGDPWDMNNLQGLCHEDHSRKTALESQS